MIKSNRRLWWLACWSLIALGVGLLLLWWAAGPGEKSVEELAVKLFDEDAKVRLEAAIELRERGPDAQDATAQLIEALKDKDADVQAAAADALVAIGKPAVPDLIASLKYTVEPVRRISIVVLAQVGSEAVPALTAGLAMDDPRIHNGALTALARIGRPAVLPLGRVLKTHRNAWVRHRAALALGIIGPPARSAVPNLIDSLKDGSADVRRAAAKALGRIGPAARAALPGLTIARHDEDPSVAKMADDALHKINNPPAR